MDWQAKWICAPQSIGAVSPVYTRSFDYDAPLSSAVLHITALGVYRAELNGSPVTESLLNPGYTAYRKRLQVQEYDVTGLVEKRNTLRVTVGKGWYYCRMGLKKGFAAQRFADIPFGMLAELTLTDKNGNTVTVSTDENWDVFTGLVRFSDIYDGETADGSAEEENIGKAVLFDGPWETLVPHIGLPIVEHEHLHPTRIFRTPKGEWVVDFGQDVTGYVALSLTAHKGDVVELSHAEVLDKDGNFYTGNYRSAKAKLCYTCHEGFQTYRPQLTFFGFRYVRLDRFPGEPKPENFTAVAVYSDIKRTGWVITSDGLLNRLIENVAWGQKDNYLDVPTDCPQRDERLGWTGDTQVFVKTGSYQFDVEHFFTKWLADLSAEQREDGAVPWIIPNIPGEWDSRAGWSDAATICPWQIYMTYGNTAVLERQFDSMCRYVDNIGEASTTPYLWTGKDQFADWLGLDAPSGSYQGSSRADLIASAYYAYSTELVIKAGHVLGRDVSAYETLYGRIVDAFRQTYPTYVTQTEMALAVHFRLAKDLPATAKQLAEKIKADGNKLQTGFIGTPYLLHALSAYGYNDLAYTLLLRKEYPSWLYSVTKGATTMWEHWDGIMEDGSFWSDDMNSYNHYAYGAVLDWVYEQAAGIRPVEEAPGFARVTVAPHPDKRLEWLQAEINTRHGKVRSFWSTRPGEERYEISVPVPATVILDGVAYSLEPGDYVFGMKQ